MTGISMNKKLIVSLHDLHPASLKDVAGQVEFCRERGVDRFSILAIPHYHHGKKLADNADALRWLDERASAGDDLVLHGFYHDRFNRAGGSFFFTRFYTANEAEFLDMTAAEVLARLEEGGRLWKERGWPLAGFIAPGWLFPFTQDALLKEFGFDYTTRLRGIYALKKDRFIRAQSLCYSTRAAWRIVASLAWNRFLFQRLLKQPVMRLSLHPQDLSNPSVRRQIGDFLELALAEGFEPVSYKEYVSAL
ncbi:MAG: polysaccharide deacetylase family protein [bacterium]